MPSRHVTHRASRHRHHHRHNHYYHHDYYRHHGLHLSFVWGSGFYLGYRYYYPFHHYHSGIDFAFFYSAPLCYAYVPYGFYTDTTPVYIEREVIRESYPVTEYVTEESEATPAAAGDAVEPRPAAASPTVERFLREASEAFRETDYQAAADKFRLAAISAPDEAAPLFAFGQALLALGNDWYAARVIRKAVRMNPDLLKEAGDIVGVYRDQDEFDRVMTALEARAESSQPGSDTRFLLAVQRYFSGDPRARADFAGLVKIIPNDEVLRLFRTAVEERFKAEEELPPVTPDSAPR